MSRRHDPREILAFCAFVFSFYLMIGFFIASVIVQGVDGSHLLSAGWICLVPTVMFGVLSGVIE